MSKEMVIEVPEEVAREWRKRKYLILVSSLLIVILYFVVVFHFFFDLIFTNLFNFLIILAISAVFPLLAIPYFFIVYYTPYKNIFILRRTLGKDFKAFPAPLGFFLGQLKCYYKGVEIKPILKMPKSK